MCHSSCVTERSFLLFLSSEETIMFQQNPAHTLHPACLCVWKLKAIAVPSSRLQVSAWLAAEARQLDMAALRLLHLSAIAPSTLSVGSING